MSMRHALVLLPLLLVPTATYGQRPTVTGLREMRALAALVGEWEGSGWVDAGPNGRIPFTVHESARWAAGGTVLVLDGLGLQKLEDGSEQAVHQAFAVVSWDAGEGTYRMRAYRAGGGEVTDRPTVGDGHLSWGFHDPRVGQIRFTLSIDEDAWHEVGERSGDGASWQPFLEMSLRRTGSSSPGS